MVGGFGAAAAFSGLYGPIAGMPASLLSLIFLPAAFFALLSAGPKIPLSPTWLAIAPSVVIYLLILDHASPNQFVFMFDPSQWHLRQDRYVDAKLLAISIAFIPQLAAIVMIACVPERERAIKGVFFTLAALAALAALRILIEQGSGLIRTDKIIASNTLLSSKYSLVSYGLLLTIGAVAPLVFKRGWILSGVLLFFAALICRRADVFSLMACLIAMSIYFGLKKDIRAGSKIFYSLILGVFLFSALHNEYNISYFSAIGRAIELRIGMTSESLAALSEEGDEPQAPIVDSAARQSYSHFSGAGLGQYHNVAHSKFAYPHNFALEILIEIGIISFILCLILLFSPLLMGGILISKRKSSDSLIFSISCFCIAIIFSFKAGEMSDLGRITFLSGIALLVPGPRSADY